MDFVVKTPTFTILLATGALLAIWKLQSRPGHPFPPGPLPRLILGNITEFTLKELWLKATVWARQYGDVCHLYIPGQHFVFLSSSEAVSELLEKRGAIYSGKPVLQMTQLCGADGLLPFLQYDDTFRCQRRLMQKTLGPRSIPAYHSMIQTETNVFLRALLKQPSAYRADIRKYSGGLTLSVVYGYQVKSADDKYLGMAEECISLLANDIASLGSFWAVNAIPVLRYLPAWFPGAEFQRKAAIWKPKFTTFIREPFEWSKEAARNGTILPSCCSQSFGEDELDPVMENDLMYSTSSMYAASADTTLASISQFILAMVQHPDVMKKAQQELDSVVGSDRLPAFSDRESLPYVEAIISEVWRWGTPVPLNLPHTTTQDDEYLGMYIPKNTIVIANIWAILHDEKLFPNPDTFNPNNYLEIQDEALKERRDPRNYIFGFGRRRCPGADLVESSIWLLIVSTLATMDISKKLDPDGQPIEPRVCYSDPVFRTPDKFEFDVKARSPQALELINSRGH